MCDFFIPDRLKNDCAKVRFNQELIMRKGEEKMDLCFSKNYFSSFFSLLSIINRKTRMPVNMIQSTAITTQIMPSARIRSDISMSDAYEVTADNRKVRNKIGLMNKRLR